MTVRIYSFGTKYPSSRPPGVEDLDLYDCQELYNPWRRADLKDLDGMHWKVQMFVRSSDNYLARMNPIFDRLEDRRTYAFFCRGGIHRSVVCAEDLATRCQSRALKYELSHRVLGIHRKG